MSKQSAADKAAMAVLKKIDSAIQNGNIESLLNLNEDGAVVIDFGEFDKFKPDFIERCARDYSRLFLKKYVDSPLTDLEKLGVYALIACMKTNEV